MYHRLVGWSDCAGNPRLGPHITSAFFAYNIDEVSTFTVENGQLTGKRQLTLSDIMAPACSTIAFDVYSAYANTLPSPDDISYRCFPRIAMPTNVFDFGKPWWNGCTLYGENTGIIDPPYALTPGAVPSSIIVEPIDPNETAAPTVFPNIQATEVPVVETTTTPVPAATPYQDVPINTGLPTSQAPATPTATPTASSIAEPPLIEPSASRDGPVVNDPLPTVSLSIISTNIVAEIPKESGSGHETVEDVAIPVTQADDDPLVVVFTSGPTNNNPNTAVTLTMGSEQANENSNIAATGGQPEKVVYKSQTLQMGGPAKTISSLNAVISYGTNGVIVQYPHGIETTVSVATGVVAAQSPNVQNEPPPSQTQPSSEVHTTNTADDAGHVASFIDYIMNGSPTPLPTVTGSSDPTSNQNSHTTLSVDPAVSSIALFSSTFGSASTNENGTTETFTGLAQKLSVTAALRVSATGYILLLLLLHVM